MLPFLISLTHAQRSVGSVAFGQRTVSYRVHRARGLITVACSASGGESVW